MNEQNASDRHWLGEESTIFRMGGLVGDRALALAWCDGRPESLHILVAPVFCQEFARAAMMIQPGDLVTGHLRSGRLVGLSILAHPKEGVDATALRAHYGTWHETASDAGSDSATSHKHAAQSSQTKVAEPLPTPLAAEPAEPKPATSKNEPSAAHWVQASHVSSKTITALRMDPALGAMGGAMLSEASQSVLVEASNALSALDPIVSGLCASMLVAQIPELSNVGDALREQVFELLASRLSSAALALARNKFH